MLGVQVHEVVVHNRDPHSVLTWDFDVLRHEVYFSVFRSTKELQPPEQPAGEIHTHDTHTLHNTPSAGNITQNSYII